MQPIHTGSDEKHGTASPIRKEKRILNDVKLQQSKFKSESQKRNAVLHVLLAVYRSIDRELKSRHYGFYDAFMGKVMAAATARTKEQFLTELCRGCGVCTIQHGNNVVAALDMFIDEEFLQVVRDDIQYLMLMLRHAVQEKADPVFTADSPEQPNISFVKKFEWIPLIAANGIRGSMRRVVMRHFLESIGIEKGKYGVEKTMYHQLMTGGNITGRPAFEDIELREKYIKLCPMAGLLGSAIGTMTIQGNLKVCDLRPECKEHGTGSESFWQYISRDFGTRMDTSKVEKDIDVTGKPAAAKSANQMIYSYETLATGTPFTGMFVLTSTCPVQVSAFWFFIRMWKDYGYVGGKSAVGKGLLDIDVEIPAGAEDLYLQTIQENREAALEFFGDKIAADE